jgi:hypothetical protein
MVKHGLLLVVVGSLGLSSSLAAQQTSDPEQIQMKPLPSLSGTDTLAFYQMVVSSKVDSSALVDGLAMLTLLDGQGLPVSTEMGRMGMAQLDLFPNALPGATEVQTASVSVRNRQEGKDFSADGKDYSPMGISRSHPIYYSGEIGFLYGHATGKYGGDVKQTYMIGEVGDDNVHITVGGFYEDSNFQFPRRGR